MKSTDKLTKELLLPRVIGYCRANKCNVIIFECEGCGVDFMLASKARKSGIEGVLVEYGEKEITVKNEKGNVIKKVPTILEKAEKKIRVKKPNETPVVKIDIEKKSQEPEADN